jgi:hypothetical protein
MEPYFYRPMTPGEARQKLSDSYAVHFWGRMTTSWPVCPQSFMDSLFSQVAISATTSCTAQHYGPFCVPCNCSSENSARCNDGLFGSGCECKPGYGGVSCSDALPLGTLFDSSLGSCCACPVQSSFFPAGLVTPPGPNRFINPNPSNLELMKSVVYGDAEFVQDEEANETVIQLVRKKNKPVRVRATQRVHLSQKAQHHCLSLSLSLPTFFLFSTTLLTTPPQQRRNIHISGCARIVAVPGRSDLLESQDFSLSVEFVDVNSMHDGTSLRLPFPLPCFS